MLCFSLFILACEEPYKPHPVNHKPPSMPCKRVKWSSWPAITYGYQHKEFDTIRIETYRKNAHFDTLLKTYIVINDGGNFGDPDYKRGFSWPEGIMSDVDLLITMGKRDRYHITDIKTGWESHICQSFCGYYCEIRSFLVNGEKQVGNLRLQNPDFIFPSDSLVYKRQRIKEASSSASCISFAALAIPFATSSRNKATPCPRS